MEPAPAAVAPAAALVKLRVDGLFAAAAEHAALLVPLIIVAPARGNDTCQHKPMQQKQDSSNSSRCCADVKAELMASDVGARLLMSRRCVQLLSGSSNAVPVMRLGNCVCHAAALSVKQLTTVSHLRWGTFSGSSTLSDSRECSSSSLVSAMPRFAILQAARERLGLSSVTLWKPPVLFLQHLVVKAYWIRCWYHIQLGM
jgi:hypothetical protein